MAFAIRAKIEGVEALQATLKNLTGACQRKVLRPALNAEGTRILQAARRNVPVKTKLLRKSLGKKIKTYKDGTVIVVVGPRRGFKQVNKGKAHNPSFYAHLVEFGAKPHFLSGAKGHQQVAYRTKDGVLKFRQRPVYTKRMHPGSPPQRPMTRAAESALVGAAQRMAASMAVEIEKLAAKGKLKTVG